MANNIWSENIQGIKNLDLSREMRFRGRNRSKKHKDIIEL